MKTQTGNTIDVVSVVIGHHEAMGKREAQIAATLRELEREMLASYDVEKTARVLLHAHDMYHMLKRAVHPNDFVSTKEIRSMLYRIDAKEAE